MDEAPMNDDSTDGADEPARPTNARDERAGAGKRSTSSRTARAGSGATRDCFSDHYACATDGVLVSVEPFFLDSQSFPDMEHYVWAYRVRIANNRMDPVRLRARYWRITDGLGRVSEVAGDGVVGEQPTIKPGDAYEYTSGAPLPTPSGLMSGRYEMENAEGDRFYVEIPAFSLDSPHEARLIN